MASDCPFEAEERESPCVEASLERLPQNIEVLWIYEQLKPNSSSQSVGL